MNADILPEHSSRTKCTTSRDTKDLVNSIVRTFSKLSLNTKTSLESRREDYFDLASLQQQCSSDEFAVILKELSVN